jgi:hypothetical protein
MKDHNTCCIYHVEIDELCTTFNNMQKSTHDFDSTWKCQICGSNIACFGVCCKTIVELLSPICGKALCAKKANLCNGTNVNVCLVNVTNAVLIC